MLLSCHNKSLFNEHLSRGGGGGSSLARGAIRARSAAVSLHKNIGIISGAHCARRHRRIQLPILPTPSHVTQSSSFLSAPAPTPAAPAV